MDVSSGGLQPYDDCVNSKKQRLICCAPRHPGYHRYLNPRPQILVLDAGGQYCHLIARKVRDLGVYAEVRASETPARELAFAKGLIISGGPSSVYDSESPTVDPAIFRGGQPVFGICYGQQLMAHLLGGVVTRGEKGEYGLATLELDA